MIHPQAPWQSWGWPWKDTKRAVAPFLEISALPPKQLAYYSHTLVYEITQSMKTNHPICGGLWPSEMAHTPSVESVSPRATLAFWDTPHSVCGMRVSLNKSTSYLSLCLSLNSVCDETYRTWASLSPETRCVISRDSRSQSQSDLCSFSVGPKYKL